MKKYKTTKKMWFFMFFNFCLKTFYVFQQLSKYSQKCGNRSPFSKMADVAQQAQVLIFDMLLLGLSSTQGRTGRSGDRAIARWAAPFWAGGPRHVRPVEHRNKKKILKHFSVQKNSHYLEINSAVLVDEVGP